MKIVIPDDYQDIVDQLECFSLIRHHEVIRYREPASDLAQLVERLCDADVIVSIRERVEFSRPLLERLPKLKLIVLVGRNSKVIDFAACTELGIPVATGNSNSPVAPAELALALIVASRRNVALEAERMKRGDWPCTLSHRLRGSTLGIFGLGAIGQLVAEGGRGLGMDILVWGQKSSLEKAAAAGPQRHKQALRAFRRVVRHVRLTRDTRGIVGRRSRSSETDCIDREHRAGRAHRTASLVGRAAQGSTRLRRCRRLRTRADHQRRSSVLVYAERSLHTPSWLGRMDELRAVF
jgi:D-3-phosphoglycerate dehydrogenase